MATYELLMVKDNKSNGILDMVRKINTRILPEAEQAGYSLYGLFFGLFGLASNELYLVAVRGNNLTSEEKITPLASLVAGHDLSLQESYQLAPTVRPTEHTARSRAGIYVFRWFDVLNRDVDQIVKLSDEAWVPFEGGFESEVQGLFAEKDRRPEQGKMLLLTWYRDLTVWENSRKFPPEAKERFLKRHDLTVETIAIATRLFISRKK